MTELEKEGHMVGQADPTNSNPKRKLMRKIYVSDNGNDKNDGLTGKTPIRSWQRFIQLCEGNGEIIIMGDAAGKIKLIA